jgi:hypothetical protein
MGIGNVFTALFKSQDSQFYLRTATKFTLIPVFCLLLVIYSLWLFLNMNYSFFISYGFFKDEALKEAFFDLILTNLSEHFILILLFIFAMYLLGLLLSFFTLRPFDQIRRFAILFSSNWENHLQVEKMSQSRLVVQSSTILFDYLHSVLSGNHGSDVEIPEAWLTIKKPLKDFTFYFQYAFFLIVIFIISDLGLYLFTEMIYEEIINTAVGQLKINKGAIDFLHTQKVVLDDIYLFAIFTNLALLVISANSIIRRVDGVSFAFSRDIKEIVLGNHKKRLSPRSYDPGQEAAKTINDLLNELLFQEEVKIQDRVKGILGPMSETPTGEASETELPPVFAGPMGQDGGKGPRFYELITPKGYRVENLTHAELLKLLEEMEK